MAKERVVVFRDYPFAVGQKIRIDSGPRFGDWEVVDVGERKVTLRCPLTGRQLQWDRFCYYVEESDREWPQMD